MKAFSSQNKADAKAGMIYGWIHVIDDDSNGFCICSKCFHLVFDEALTGTCPYCGNHFCPSVR